MVNSRHLHISTPTLLSLVLLTVTVCNACNNKVIVPLIDSNICNGNNTVTTVFGYTNNNDEHIVVTAGSHNNRFIPDPKQRGQTENFLPGTHHNVFSVTWSPAPPYNWIKWQVRSPGNSESVKSITAFFPSNCQTTSPPSNHTSSTSPPISSSTSQTTSPVSTSSPVSTTTHPPLPCGNDSCYINGPPITIHESSSVTLEPVGDGIFRVCAIFDNPMGIFWMTEFENLTFCKLNEFNPPHPRPSPSQMHFDMYRVCDSYVPHSPALQQDDCSNMRTDHYSSDFSALLETDPYLYHGWTYSLTSPGSSRQRACHEFSINSISRCRTREYVYGQDETENGTLVTVDQNGMHMNASLFINAYDKTGCENVNGDCQNLRHSIKYSIDVNYRTGGELHVLVKTGTVDITLTWVKIIWLPDGRVMVVLKTSISQLDQPPGHIPPVYTTKLSDYEIIAAQETGTPMQIVQYTDCIDSSPPDRCEQFFMMVSDYPILESPSSSSSNARESRSDESLLFIPPIPEPVFLVTGYKPTKADIVINDIIHLATAILHVNLDIEHGEDEDLEDQFDAIALAFHDRQMTQPYSPYELGQRLLLDCSKLYILVQGNVPECYDLQILNVTVCIATNGTMDPYDPSHPETTGCNTVDANVVWGLIWSRDPSKIADPFFHGEYLSEYQTSHDREGVGMSIHKFDDNDQYILVNYDVVHLDDCDTDTRPHENAKRGIGAPISIGSRSATLNTVAKSPISLGDGKSKVIPQHDGQHGDFDNCEDHPFDQEHEHEHGCLIHIFPDCPDGYFFDDKHHHRCISYERQHFDGWFGHNFVWIILCIIIFVVVIIAICGTICAFSHRLSRSRKIYHRHHHTHHPVNKHVHIHTTKRTATPPAQQQPQQQIQLQSTSQHVTSVVDLIPITNYGVGYDNYSTRNIVPDSVMIGSQANVGIAMEERQQ
jgi:hypothetical protein